MEPIGFNKRNIKTAITNDVLPLSQGKISERTADFVDRIFNSTTEVVLEFLDSNATKINLRNPQDTLYCYNNLLLARTNAQRAYDLEQNLKKVESLGISPKHVQYFKLADDDFLTVLEVGEDKLLPYCENIYKVPLKSKQVFKSKIKELLDKGFNNKEIFANKDALLIDKHCKIYFADWTSLEPISGTKKQALNAYLKNIQF